MERELSHVNCEERPPWFARAFELFTYEYFDSTSAAMLARSEWEQRQRLEQNERSQRPVAE